MEALKKVTALIRERTVPVASEGLLTPTKVVQRVQQRLPAFNMHVHTQAWKAYAVRPPTRSGNPAHTRPEFCLYDALAKGYGYTEAWVNFLVRQLREEAEFDRVRNWDRGGSSSAAVECRPGTWPG